MYIYISNTILLPYPISYPQKILSPEGIYEKKYKLGLHLGMLKRYFLIHSLQLENTSRSNHCYKPISSKV